MLDDGTKGTSKGEKKNTKQIKTTLSLVRIAEGGTHKTKRGEEL